MSKFTISFSISVRPEPGVVMLDAPQTIEIEIEAVDATTAVKAMSQHLRREVNAEADAVERRRRFDKAADKVPT